MTSVLEDWRDYEPGLFTSGGPWSPLFNVNASTSSIVEVGDDKQWAFGQSDDFVGMILDHALDGVAGDIDISFALNLTAAADSISGVGLTWRNTDGQETRYRASFTNTHLQVHRINDDVFAQLGSWELSQAGQGLARVRHVGSSLQVWLDGNSVLSTTESVLPPGSVQFRGESAAANIHYVILGDPLTAEPHVWTPPENETNVTFGAWVAYNLEQDYPESYVNLGTQVLEDFEDNFLGGYRLKVVNHFDHWGSPGPTEFPGGAWMNPLLDMPSAPLGCFTVMPFGVSIADVASGDHDDLIQSWAESIQSWTVWARGNWGATAVPPIVLRWGHEMNGSWYSWSGSPATYIAAWRRIVERTRAVTKNVLFFWCPNSNFPGSDDLVDYWPGAEFVDIVGHDAYPFEEPTQSWDDVHRATYDSIVALPGADGKPYWIGETAYPVNYGSSPAFNRNRYNEYVRDMFESINDYPNVEAVMWFSENKFEAGADVDFSLDTAGTVAHRSMADGLATWSATDPLLSHVPYGEVRGSFTIWDGEGEIPMVAAVWEDQLERSMRVGIWDGESEAPPDNGGDPDPGEPEELGVRIFATEFLLATGFQVDRRDRLDLGVVTLFDREVLFVREDS